MSKAAHFEGIVLRRDPAGERHLRLTLLSTENGVTQLLYRPQTKYGTMTVTPDIFDDAEIFPDMPRGETGGIPFVKEYRLQRRRTELAKDYTRLDLACRLSGILADNPHPPESWSDLHALSRTAFDALESRPHPEATALKFLWKIARDEGWPVREDWQTRLPEQLCEQSAVILSSPLHTISEETKPTIHELLQRLEHWLEHEAHYVIKSRR